MDGGVGAFIALNSDDGTERYIDYFGEYETSPAIAEDGTVYAVTSDTGGDYGILHAFGKGPLRADAGGPYSGLVNTSISFSGSIYGGAPPYICYWEFGDGGHSDEQNPSHSYAYVGDYTATFTVTDSEGNHSSDTTKVSITYPLPSVTITNPINGIYLMNRRILPFYKPVIIGRITIEAVASQIPLGIDRVEFYVGDTLEATDTTAPYSWTWKGIHPLDTYRIRAFAYDTTQRSSVAIIYVLRII
jgi:PKD repeat protein